MSQSMTYNSLLTDVLAYSERTDDDFEAHLPRFVMLAEHRISTEMKILGFQTVVRGLFEPGNSVIPKPQFWKQTISLNYIDPAGGHHDVRLRQYEYLRVYWPNPNVTGLPEFYADYNIDKLFVAPTPGVAYSFELLYYARLDPLSVENQTSWLTVAAPQLILYGTLLESAIYLKNPEKAAEYQSYFDRAMAALNGEDKVRTVDRTQALN